MSVLNKIATAVGRRNEIPNQLLAKEIAAKRDKKGVKELIDNLYNKNKNIQADCIKTLYEIGYIDSTLIMEYEKEFIKLLESKINRMQWGAMIALSTIVSNKPKQIYSSLAKIVEVGDKGTVITKDHLVKILASLGKFKQYNDDAFQLLIEQLQKSAINQFPSYAEFALSIVNEKNKKLFANVIEDRLKEIDQPAKIKRLEKVLKRLTQ